MESAFHAAYTHVVGSELAAAFAVAQFHFGSGDFNPVTVFDLVGHLGVVAHNGNLRLVVDKFTVGGVLHTNRGVGDYGEANIVVGIGNIVSRRGEHCAKGDSG